MKPPNDLPLELKQRYRPSCEAAVATPGVTHGPRQGPPPPPTWRGPSRQHRRTHCRGRHLRGRQPTEARSGYLVDRQRQHVAARPQIPNGPGHGLPCRLDCHQAVRQEALRRPNMAQPVNPAAPATARAGCRRNEWRWQIRRQISLAPCFVNSGSRLTALAPSRAALTREWRSDHIFIALSISPCHAVGARCLLRPQPGHSGWGF